MIDDRQKRAFLALACKVAWADGEVADTERAQVTALLQRLGGTPVTAAELDEWLTTGAPPAELAELSPVLGEMFLYEAWELVRADGDIADSEARLIEGLMTRVAKRHEGTPVAKVALVKRAVHG